MKAATGLMLLLLVTGCAGNPVTDEERHCAEELDAINAEFKQAQAAGFSDNLTLLKASALINAAFAQKQFGKFAGCLEKVGRARAYIADAQKR